MSPAQAPSTISIAVTTRSLSSVWDRSSSSSRNESRSLFLVTKEGSRSLESGVSWLEAGNGARASAAAATRTALFIRALRFEFWRECPLLAADAAARRCDEITVCMGQAFEGDLAANAVANP